MKKQKKLVVFAFGVVFVALNVGGLLFHKAIDQSNQARQWVDHTYEVELKVRTLLRSLVDQETGVRGYIATNDELYLEPYKEGDNKIRGLLRSVQFLVKDDPEELNQILSVRQIVQSEKGIWGNAILAQRQGKSDMAYRTLYGNNHSKVIMDQTRAILEEIVSQREVLLQDRYNVEDRAKQDEINTFNDTLIAIVLSLFFLLSVILYTPRQCNRGEAS